MYSKGLAKTTQFSEAAVIIIGFLEPVPAEACEECHPDWLGWYCDFCEHTLRGDGYVSSVDESSMSDPNDSLYEIELGDLVNPAAGNENDPATPAKKPRVGKSGEPTNPPTSVVRNATALMAQLAELDDAEDGQPE